MTNVPPGLYLMRQAPLLGPGLIAQPGADCHSHVVRGVYGPGRTGTPGQARDQTRMSPWRDAEAMVVSVGPDPAPGDEHLTGDRTSDRPETAVRQSAEGEQQ